MKARTITANRKMVDAVFSNHQRAIWLRPSDETKIGDVVRLVSDEPDINKRRDVFRIATHREESFIDACIVSLRPLTPFETEVLRTPDFGGGVPPSDDNMLLMVRNEFQRAVKLAAKVGVVITIEQKPLEPLAMRNYETVVSVRMAR